MSVMWVSDFHTTVSDSNFIFNMKLVRVSVKCTVIFWYFVIGEVFVCIISV